MAKINAKQCEEIGELLNEIEEYMGQDGEYESMYHVLSRQMHNLLPKAKLMLEVINDIRDTVKHAEDPGVIEDVAQQLGTTNAS